MVEVISSNLTYTRDLRQDKVHEYSKEKMTTLTTELWHVRHLTY